MYFIFTSDNHGSVCVHVCVCVCVCACYVCVCVCALHCCHGDTTDHMDDVLDCFCRVPHFGNIHRHILVVVSGYNQYKLVHTPVGVSILSIRWLTMY